MYVQESQRFSDFCTYIYVRKSESVNLVFQESLNMFYNVRLLPDVFISDVVQPDLLLLI